MVELKERKARAAPVDRQVDVQSIAQGVQQVRSIDARGIASSVKYGKELTLAVANGHDLVAHHLPDNLVEYHPLLGRGTLQ